MDWIEAIGIAAGIFGFLLFIHKVIFIVVAFTQKTKQAPKPLKQGRYGVLIAARNEEDVIGQLIESIHAQKYPSKLIDIYVIADNCTDNTAEVCRLHGAKVYERFNNFLKGKGYALDTLISHLKEDGYYNYDAYFVFDADNLLDENYFDEMDREYQNGNYDAVTSYRNSKNFDDNWISAGYGLTFLREAQLLNRPRHLLNTSSNISGTGFMISTKALDRTDGWKFFLLSEDSEFTAYTVSVGGKIGYCERAVFYDEQPTDFKTSWNQRIRWAKGYLQVLGKYGLPLFKTMFSKGSFACWDMICSFLPAFVVVTVNVLNWITELIIRASVGESLLPMLGSAIGGMITMYGILYLLGLLTTISEWKLLRASTRDKILYTFTFPIFMLTFVPISAKALFCRVEWKPIKHKAASSVDKYLK